MENDIHELEYFIKNWGKGSDDKDILKKISQKVVIKDSIKSLIQSHIDSTKALINEYKDIVFEIDDLERQLRREDEKQKENKYNLEKKEVFGQNVNTNKRSIENNTQELNAYNQLKSILNNRSHVETNLDKLSNNTEMTVDPVSVDTFVYDIFKQHQKFMHVSRVVELLGGESENSRFKGYGSLNSKVSHAFNRWKKKGRLISIKIGGRKSTHQVIWGGANWIKDKYKDLAQLTAEDIKDEHMFEQNYLPAVTSKEL